MRAISIMAGLAVIGILCACMSVSAAPATLLLYDSGDASTADFIFAVGSPGSTALDSDYLNLTVRSYPVSSGSGTNASWYVLVSLYDGTTNYSWNQSLAVVNDASVYSNISLATPGDYFVENSSALLTVVLKDATYVQQDVVVAEFAIYSSEMNEAILGVIPVLITLVVVAAMLPMLKKMTRKV